MNELKGKCLVRRAKTGNGKQVLIICGIFEPSDDINNYSNRDEMWATKLLIMDSLKFVNAKDIQMSPEDFLSNANNVQDKRNWEKK